MSLEKDRRASFQTSDLTVESIFTAERRRVRKCRQGGRRDGTEAENEKESD